MRRIILLLLCLLSLPLVGSAQVPLFQVYGGYAYTHVDSGGVSNLVNPGARDWNGWAASFAGNFTRHFGVVFDCSGAYGPSYPLNPTGIGPRVHEETPFLHAYLAGPQFLLPLGRVLFFAHGLAGATQMRRGFMGVDTTISRSDFAFGGAVGGGIDLSLTRDVALRLAQADYLIGKNFGVTGNDLRVSGGIVFQLGSR